MSYPVSYKEIFKPIIVIVGKEGSPAPVCFKDAGHLPYFTEPVPAFDITQIKLKHIPYILRRIASHKLIHVSGMCPHIACHYPFSEIIFRLHVEGKNID